MDALLPFFLRGVVAPAAVATGFLAVLGRRRAAPALALGLGYVVGHALLRWPWPVAESTDRIPVLVLAALVLAALSFKPATPSAPQRRARTLESVFRLGLSVTTVWWFLSTLLASRSAGETVGLVTGLALIIVVVWTSLERLAAREDGPPLPVLLTVLCMLGAATLTVANSAFHGQLAGALGAALAAMTVFAWTRSPVKLAGGAVGPYVIITSCLWMGGSFLSVLPTSSALLLAIAPCGAWAGEWSGVRTGAGTDRGRRRPARATLLAFGVPMLLAGAALVIAWIGRPPPNPYY